MSGGRRHGVGSTRQYGDGRFAVLSDAQLSLALLSLALLSLLVELLLRVDRRGRADPLCVDLLRVYLLRVERRLRSRPRLPLAAGPHRALGAARTASLTGAAEQSPARRAC